MIVSELTTIISNSLAKSTLRDDVINNHQIKKEVSFSYVGSGLKGRRIPIITDFEPETVWIKVR